MSVAALTLCGILHVVGSERDSALALDTAAERVQLVGPAADSLLESTWPRVCVEGEPLDGVAYGFAFALRVGLARPVGDGKHAPIVGAIAFRAGSYRMSTADGHEFALSVSDAALSAMTGKRAWVVGRWSGGRIVVSRLGPF